MGNKPIRNSRIQQPYNQMVEDAISALKERPGSTQNDVFNYLETKYEGRIPPKAKKNLETVIRSVIKTKNGMKRGNGRPTRSTARKVKFKTKLSGPRRKPAGRLPARGRVRKLVTRPGKDLKKKAHKALTSGKKPYMPGAKPGGHRLLKKVRRAIPRDSAAQHRPMSRRSVGSFCLPRRAKERS